MTALRAPHAVRLDAEVAPGIPVTLERGATAADDGAGLTPDDLAAAAGLPEWRARERLAARRALRRLLAEHFPEARHDPVAYTPEGRPWLVGRPRLGISLSHDGDAVAACAALDRAVGVDLQHPPATVSDPLLRRCAKDHAERLARLSADRRATEFAWLWTVREALVKAEGTGIAGGLWSADLVPYATDGAWGSHRWVSLREQSPIPLSCAYTALPYPPATRTAPGEPRE